MDPYIRPIFPPTGLWLISFPDVLTSRSPLIQLSYRKGQPKYCGFKPILANIFDDWYKIRRTITTITNGVLLRQWSKRNISDAVVITPHNKVIVIIDFESSSHI